VDSDDIVAINPSPPDERRLRRAGAGLAGILLVALALRLIPIAFHRNDPRWVLTPDSQIYLVLADRLATTGAFTRAPLKPSVLESPIEPETFRTPGYPALIAALWTIGGHGLGRLILLGILLDVAAVAGCYLAGARLSSPAIGLVAAAFVAIDVGHIVYSNLIMSDVLFACCQVAALALAARAARTGHPTSAAVAGLLLSAATAVRPVGVFLGVIFAVGLWLARRHRVAAWLLAASLAFPVVWIARNTLTAGWPVLSSAHYFNLHYYAASRVTARVEGISVADALERNRTALEERLTGKAPPEWAAEYQRYGAHLFAAHPQATALEVLTSLGEMLLAGERRGLFNVFASDRGAAGVPAIREGRRTITAIVRTLASRDAVEVGAVVAQIAWMGLVWLMAVHGSWRMLRDRRWPEACLLLLPIAYLLAASAMEGSGRMRLGFSPYLFLVAGYGVCSRGQ
jgi:hypothetical protein